MSEETNKIKKLLEHWIEHNDEHVKRFKDVSKEAINLSLVDVAEHMRLAAEKGDEVTIHLQKALSSIK